MKGFEAYQQQSASWTRIDMLLAAYNGTIARLEEAVQLINNDQTNKAQPLLIRAQRLVIELYAGLDLSQGAIPENMQKIYIYVLSCLTKPDVENVESAVKLLTTIREGLESIRVEAIALEQQGVITPISSDTLTRHQFIA